MVVGCLSYCWTRHDVFPLKSFACISLEVRLYCFFELEFDLKSLGNNDGSIGENATLKNWGGTP